ncbi:MAG: hypothetical protein J6J24_02160 [Clostridia bacterium]|nr:hypothetical protein [Clostridia bacterium]
MRKRGKKPQSYVAAQNDKQKVESQAKSAESIDGEKLSKEYLDLLRFQTKQKNLLLGNFSADGKYALTDEKFLKELKAVPKKFQEKSGNVAYANAILGPYILRFKIEFDITESYCSSVLSFFEIEHGLEEDKKHITVLDKHLAIYSPTYNEEVYRLWKVYFDEEVYEKNDFLHDYLKKREEEFLFSLELTEVLAQIYLVRMLKFLEGFGELGLKIKQEYKLLVEKLLAKDPLLMQNYTKLKQVLDSVIIKNNALTNIAKTPEGASILKEYVEPLNKVNNRNAPAVIDAAGKDIKKEDDKKKEKAKEPAKKKGKPKSKGGASFKPFIFDPKKGFGKMNVGGYSIPKFNFSSGGKESGNGDKKPKDDPNKNKTQEKNPKFVPIIIEKPRPPKPPKQEEVEDYLDDLLDEVADEKKNYRTNEDFEDLNFENTSLDEIEKDKNNEDAVKAESQKETKEDEELLDDVLDETAEDLFGVDDQKFDEEEKRKEKKDKSREL